jgi:hypothetical protein
MERLQTYRRTLAEDLVSQRERLAGDHIRRMSALVNTYVPAASSLPQALIASQAPSIAARTYPNPSNASSRSTAATTTSSSDATINNNNNNRPSNGGKKSSTSAPSKTTANTLTVGHFMQMQPVPAGLAAAVAALDEQEVANVGAAASTS